MRNEDLFLYESFEFEDSDEWNEMFDQHEPPENPIRHQDTNKVAYNFMSLSQKKSVPLKKKRV